MRWVPVVENDVVKVATLAPVATIVEAVLMVCNG